MRVDSLVLTCRTSRKEGGGGEGLETDVREERLMSRCKRGKFLGWAINRRTGITRQLYRAGQWTNRHTPTGTYLWWRHVCTGYVARAAAAAANVEPAALVMAQDLRPCNAVVNCGTHTFFSQADFQPENCQKGRGGKLAESLTASQWTAAMLSYPCTNSCQPA